MAHLRRSEKEREWRRILKEQRASGLSARAFCQERGLAKPRFYFWRKEVARRDVEQADLSSRIEADQRASSRLPAFTQLLVEAAEAPHSRDSLGCSAPLEIVLPSGICLRIRAGCEPEMLRQVLAVLEQPAC
jgi:transposase